MEEDGALGLSRCDGARAHPGGAGRPPQRPAHAGRAGGRAGGGELIGGEGREGGEGATGIGRSASRCLRRAHALRSDLREPRNNLEARCFVCHYLYLGNVLNKTDVYRNG